MIQIFETTKSKGRNSHRHLLVGIRDEQQPNQFIFKMTEAYGHSHPVELDLTDAGQPMPDPFKIGEANGHKHDVLSLYQPKAIEDERNENDILGDAWDLYNSAAEFMGDSIEEGKICEGFYDGDGHWKNDTSSTLDEKGKACLTIGYVEPIIDSLSGYQRRNRTDIHCYPVEASDGLAADIMNECLKQVLNENRYDIKESQVFDDKSITGIGNIEVYPSYDSNPEGDIIVDHFQWDECYHGPHNDPSGDDRDFLVKWKWTTLNEIKRKYPDKAHELDGAVNSAINGKTITIYRDTNHPYREDAEDITNKTEGETSFIAFNEVVDISKKNIKLISIEQKLRHPAFKLSIYKGLSHDGGEHFDIKNYPMSDVRAIQDLEDVILTKFTVPEMLITVIAGNVLLDHYKPTLYENPCCDFTIIPDYAKKRKGKFWGKVKPLIDLQKQIDKVDSLIVDYAMKANANPTFYTPDTFTDPIDAENFKKYGSSPGYTAEIKSFEVMPKQMESSKIPPDLVNFSTLAPQRMRDISNVNLAMAGQGQGDSSKALSFQEEKGLIGNEFLFDNSKIAKRKLGEMVIKIIQKIYTPERILRILNAQNLKEPVEIGGQPLEAYKTEDILKVLQNHDLIKYDLVVDESMHTPSKRIRSLVTLQQMQTAGMQVPPNIILDLIDMPEKTKKEWKMLIAQEAQNAQTETAMKSFAEKFKPMAKDLAAKGLIPQDILQQLVNMGQPMAQAGGPLPGQMR